jgi:hypothetical protein
MQLRQPERRCNVLGLRKDAFQGFVRYIQRGRAKGGVKTEEDNVEGRFCPGKLARVIIGYVSQLRNGTTMGCFLEFAHLMRDEDKRDLVVAQE